MGKKVNQASTKICKAAAAADHNKKQFNNMINVLKPKVYITDASNFKKLVQELTGNINYPASISFNPHPPIHHHQKPVIMQVPNIIDNIDLTIQDHQDMYRSRELSFDSSVDSSEASFPTADHESSPEEEEIFDVLESSNIFGASSSFNNNNNNNNIVFPDCGDIESWLLEIDNYCIPTARAGFQQDHFSLCDYDFSELI